MALPHDDDDELEMALPQQSRSVNFQTVLSNSKFALAVLLLNIFMIGSGTFLTGILQKRIRTIFIAFLQAFSAFVGFATVWPFGYFGWIWSILWGYKMWMQPSPQNSSSKTEQTKKSQQLSFEKKQLLSKQTVVTTPSKDHQLTNNNTSYGTRKRGQESQSVSSFNIPSSATKIKIFGSSPVIDRNTKN
mmetsp:Transcript_42869/g.70880  ORF Transcript_42869/g.70880 Transcript_42869/m.70880 type:complete len:189 (-) Transcript_42869:108-674(-)